VSTLSLQFTNILAAVNLREAETHQSAKKGRDTAREVATVSFHSLRHSAVSLLKAAGVPDATVMGLVGHETLAMSSHYTQVGKKSLESAVASVPSFVPAPGGAQSANENKHNDKPAGHSK
jgi:site-specific recombinase XerD